MRNFLGQFKVSGKQSLDLPAHAAVALSIADDAKLMKGKCVNSQQGLGEGLAGAKKGEEDRMEKEL